MGYSRLQTYRVVNNNPNEVIGMSPNCGLLAYIVEAKIRNNTFISHSQGRSIIQRFSNEAIIYNGFHFWGWEKEPSIPNTFFPLDWDDTSKSYDVLFILKEVGFGNFSFATEEYMEFLFHRSIYIRTSIKVLNISVNCPYSLALNVFFGVGSEKISFREDPMVTVALLRMLASHYYCLYLRNENTIKEMLLRLGYLINIYIENENIKFEDISRYYFSFGHFLYRLIEVLDLLNIPLALINIDKTILINVMKGQNSRFLKSDIVWFYLLKLKFGIVSADFDPKKSISELKDEIVYQHKRLNHQYYSPNWVKMLLLEELNALTQVSISNKSMKRV